MTLKEHLTMSKGKQKRPKSDVRAATEQQAKAKAKGPDKGEKKKKFFFQRVEKKSKEKKSPILPPKEAQQFSSNWKTLLEVLNSKQAADDKKGSLQKQVHSKAPKPQSAVKKDFHKAPRKPDKHISKTGHGPKKDIKTPHSVKTESRETSSVEQNSKGPSTPKQHKAEKRKAKDGEGGGPEKYKKKKVEEVEKQPTEMDLWFDDVDPNDIEATLGTEAAEIMRKRNGTSKSNVESTESVLVKERAFEGLTSAVAMDCEMVGVGPDGEESIVARVSIVNLFGKCVYDKYVKPTEKVTDYRTAVSGIRPKDIENGEDFNTVQKEVAEILKGRTLVGHAVHNDLKILFLDHPKKMLRDTQKYKPFRSIAKSGRPALRVLCQEVLHVKVQQGEHSSVQDAQATMRLYTLVKSQWEAALKASRAQNKPRAKSAPASNSNKDQTD